VCLVQSALQRVSVLFSEPKIPQSKPLLIDTLALACFSALQRAENSSIRRRRDCAGASGVFQCSSASRKFLNAVAAGLDVRTALVSVLFSEPKIPQSHSVMQVYPPPPAFQCSSASRKFLNVDVKCERVDGVVCFSALQRAENSSIARSADALRC